MISAVAIEEAVAQVRRIGVVPVHIHVSAEGFRQLIAAIWPEPLWDQITWMCLEDLLLVVKDGLEGQDFTVCLIVNPGGPCADARRGAE